MQLTRNTVSSSTVQQQPSGRVNGQNDGCKGGVKLVPETGPPLTDDGDVPASPPTV